MGGWGARVIGWGPVWVDGGPYGWMGCERLYFNATARGWEVIKFEHNIIQTVNPHLIWCRCIDNYYLKRTIARVVAFT